MNNKNIVKVLLDLERYLEKETISYDRNHLIVLRALLFVTLRGSGQPNRNQVKRHLFRSVFDLIRSVVGLFKFYFSDSKVIAFAPASHRNTSVSGSLYSKPLDSLCWSLRKEIPLGVEFGVTTDEHANTVNFSALIDVVCKLLPASDGRSISLFINKVSNYLHRKGVIENQSDILEFNASFLRYQKRLALFRFLFRFKKIDKAYFIVYYDITFLAIIRALRERGVDVYEYQHGIQNRYQPLYSYFGQIPALAPCSIPTHFLAWNDITAKRFKEDLSGFDINVEAVGYLWKSFYKHISHSTCSKDIRPVKKAKSVLVALQAFPQYFNFEVIHALKNLDDDWLIVIREHPLFGLSPANIERYFNPSDYEATLIIDDSSIPLDERLSDASFCITGFSSVGYEAFLMGLKTIFTHENSLYGLQEYIDNKYVFYQCDRKGILNILKSSD